MAGVGTGLKSFHESMSGVTDQQSKDADTIVRRIVSLMAYISTESIDVGKINAVAMAIWRIGLRVKQTYDRLKDVDQDDSPSDGDVLIYDNGEWKYFDLQSFINETSGDIHNLEQTINNLTSRIRALELTLQRPEGIPNTSRVVWGNDINLYGDQSNTDDHTHGFFTHSINTNVTNDLYFS
jgi:hypothetical protein